jgi:small neutral amino acid transporter SnatA (MarC family)
MTYESYIATYGYLAFFFGAVLEGETFEIIASILLFWTGLRMIHRITSKSEERDRAEESAENIT